MYGSVHLVATLDAIRFHGCHPCSRAPTAGISLLTKIRSLHLYRWCTFVTPCARRDQLDIGNRLQACNLCLGTDFTEVFKLQNKCGLHLPLNGTYTLNKSSHQHCDPFTRITREHRSLNPLRDPHLAYAIPIRGVNPSDVMQYICEVEVFV